MAEVDFWDMGGVLLEGIGACNVYALRNVSRAPRWHKSKERTRKREGIDML